MSKIRWALGVLVALSTGHLAYAAPPVHSGYAIIAEKSMPTDLSQSIYVDVRGHTVLEGMLGMLEGTGYRLASEAAADPEIGRLYGQPYPESQRQVGPVELGTALERLAGPAWQLVVDPVNRLVSFEVKPSYRQRAPAPTATDTPLVPLLAEPIATRGEP